MVNLKGEKHVRIKFYSYKHSKPDPPPLYLKSRPNHKSICPVLRYIQFKKIRCKESSYFFCWSNGEPLVRSNVADMLKTHLSILGYQEQHFNTHSLRSGKTTDMANEGYSSTQIALAGRWSSDAYKKYIKPDKVIV